MLSAFCSVAVLQRLVGEADACGMGAAAAAEAPVLQTAVAWRRGWRKFGIVKARAHVQTA